MLPIELQSPREMSLALAGRVRRLRLDRGWTQQEMAERAGVAPDTYRRFERTGSISLERLLKLAVVLDACAGVDQLFVPPPAGSLDELERRDLHRSRTRGRRRDAKA